MSDLGQGLQVVQILDDHSYQLDEKLLERVLLNKEIKDLPVVVVSVAGAYRGGKSFLLNFFLRYLSSPESSQRDGSWLGEDGVPLVGFSWRGGSKRNTTGIIMWSEPFIATLNSGEKVAVLLMDTQGTFDNQSTVRDNSTIFALSTLISSVQIYNLSTMIKEDDLQNLQLFTMYGKMVQEKNYVGKAFQTLGFLVRDWRFPYDHPFGAEGGNKLLHELLKITSNQPEELQELRAQLTSSFEEVFCFLMPHPGFVVSESQEYKGNINDIELTFRQHLLQLVLLIFGADKLCPKTINGQKIKSGDLFNYFKAYMTVFNSDQIPNPKSIVQATAEAGLLSANNEARDVYENGMNAECGPTQLAVSPGDVPELHQEYLTAARTAFTNKRTMTSQEEVNKNLEKLNNELNARLPQFEQSNLSKLQAVMQLASEAYEQAFSNVSKSQPLCLHPLDLEAVHQEAVQAAMSTYDRRVKIMSKNPDTKRDELTQNLQNRFAQLMVTNDKNNKDAVNELKTEYWKFMETKSVSPALSEADFKAAHDAGLNQALTKFQARRIRPNSYPSDIFKEDLVKLINDTFVRLQGVNQDKIEQERIRQEQERQRIEQERVSAEQERVKAEQERIAKEQELIRLNQERERIEQERQRLELERQRIERENQRRKHKKCSIM